MMIPAYRFAPPNYHEWMPLSSKERVRWNGDQEQFWCDRCQTDDSDNTCFHIFEISEYVTNTPGRWEEDKSLMQRAWSVVTRINSNRRTIDAIKPPEPKRTTEVIRGIELFDANEDRTIFRLRIDRSDNSGLLFEVIYRKEGDCYCALCNQIFYRGLSTCAHVQAVLDKMSIPRTSPGTYVEFPKRTESGNKLFVIASEKIQINASDKSIDILESIDLRTSDEFFNMKNEPPPKPKKPMTRFSDLEL